MAARTSPTASRAAPTHTGERSSERTVRKAEGLFVWLAGEDAPYADLVQGFSATNWGHRHPRVVEAATRALQEIDHVTGFADPLRDRVRSRLAAGCGISGADVYFDVGGAQIVRMALHATVVATGRMKVACLENCFHGYGWASGRLMDSFLRPGVPHVGCERLESLRIGDAGTLARIREAEFSAVVVEPIQGAAGFQDVPVEWLSDVALACRESDTLLLSDEIQVGLGRAGTFTALERAGLVADVYLFGKALGGGLFPISAMVARQGILPRRPCEENGFGSTFTDNQFGVRIADVILDLLDQTLAAADVETNGAAFCAGLEESRPTAVRVAVRRYGLAVAVDFESRERAQGFWGSALSERILCHISGVRKDIVKLFPPLNLGVSEYFDLGRRLGRLLGQDAGGC